ncbi:MAG TPA: hypothetical protein VGK99_01295 [Acidobacteriota bacterium]
MKRRETHWKSIARPGTVSQLTLRPARQEIYQSQGIAVARRLHAGG